MIEFNLPENITSLLRKDFDAYQKNKDKHYRKILGVLCGNCADEDDPYVNSPIHYQSRGGIEVIDIIEEFEMNFNLGNVIKYVLRHRNKNGIQDLKKAMWYLQREINNTW